MKFYRKDITPEVFINVKVNDWIEGIGDVTTPDQVEVLREYGALLLEGRKVAQQIGVAQKKIVVKKRTCGDCNLFDRKSRGNCKTVGYGTLATNNPCDRFESKTTEEKDICEMEGSIHGYMCLVDWKYEAPANYAGNHIYYSLDSVRKLRGCTDQCGIVKVKVSFVEVVEEGEE